QRRTYPFGSDRPVPSAGDLTTPERFTGQWRLDDGGGNERQELYQFGGQGGNQEQEQDIRGAQWMQGRDYLPGIAVFTQPDPLVQKRLGDTAGSVALTV